MLKGYPVHMSSPKEIMQLLYSLEVLKDYYWAEAQNEDPTLMEVIGFYRE